MSDLNEHWFRIAWRVWIYLFIVLEAAAIILPRFTDARRLTLSANIRDELSNEPTWVLVAVGLVLLWLIPHFLFDLREP